MLDLTKFASVNQTGRNVDTTSEKYAFIPTTRVLDVLQSNGWYPTKIDEARTNRNSSNAGYQKHLIRLRQDGNEPFNPRDAIPEIVLVNSHGGTSSFRLMVGLFELVCSNGLIVQTESFGDVRISHKGFAENKVEDALASLLPTIPAVLENRETMRGIALDRSEQIVLATAAIEVAYDLESFTVDPVQLLEPYAVRGRYADRKEPTLWNTFNNIQGNILNGRVEKVNRETHDRRKSKPVKSVGENVRLNQALWVLAEGMAKLAQRG